MGLSGFAEIPDSLICFHTGLTSSELSESKQELTPKVKFTKGWVYVVNLLEHDPIVGGEKNNVYKGYIKELESVPDYIKQELEAPSKPLEAPTEGVKAMVKEKVIEKRESAEREENKLERSKEYLKNIPADDEAHIVKMYKITAWQLKKKGEDLYNWCVENGKKKDNYKAFLTRIVSDEFGKKQSVPAYIKTTSNNMGLPPEEEQISPERMAKLKEEALLKIGKKVENYL